MKPCLRFLTCFALFPLTLILAFPSPACGQAVPDAQAQNSLGKAVDSVAVNGTRPAADTAGTLDLRSPRTAMLLSLLVPGGGQFYNESYWKGGIIAATEIAFASLAVREHMLMTNISGMLPSDSASDNLVASYRDRRNAYVFLAGVAIIYSISDAYVDAHMFHFREQQTLSLVPTDKGPGLSVKLNF
jgi:hypothetical protein